MEKRSPQKMKSSNPFCVPRFRGNKNKRTLPMTTLLERLREAAFRLIMLSVLSKATSDGGSSPDLRPRKYYYPADQAYQSEAVADCIEFIKKKALTEENRDSTASTSSSTIDAAEMVRSSWS